MDSSGQRKVMVERHIRARGVRDPGVLAAMQAVPREAFLPPELAELAYDDHPLPIAAGQTISQPFIVAVMAEAAAVKPGDRVLEIGTGSGYAAAILATVASHVDTIERHRELADLASERLGKLGFANVEVRCGDGTLGWNEHAPFGAIIDYHLKSDASGPVTLEILDPAGQLVRRYASDERMPQRDPNSFNIPASWVPAAEPLSAAAGMHRWVWDLRPTPAGGGRAGGGGGFGGFGRGGAALVRPGTYSVKLTVDGRSYTQPLLVKPDPRLKQ